MAFERKDEGEKEIERMTTKQITTRDSKRSDQNCKNQSTNLDSHDTREVLKRLEHLPTQARPEYVRGSSHMQILSNIHSVAVFKVEASDLVHPMDR